MDDKNFWGEGIPELQNGSLHDDLGAVSNVVTVPRARYDELIRGEQNRDIVYRLVNDVDFLSLPMNTVQKILRTVQGEFYYKTGKLEFTSGKETLE